MELLPVSKSATSPSGLTVTAKVFLTRGEMLAFAISFALRRAKKIVRGLSRGLTEEERHAVADRTVEELSATATDGD